eukprot:gene4314-6112_t
MASSSIDIQELGMIRRKNLKLPDKLIVGYANWNQCDDSIVDAVKQGVNVVIWFSINLLTDNGYPIITNGPNMDCVAEKVQKIHELGLETVHLISIGGWNSPHPDTTNDANTVYEAWKTWNIEFAARPVLGFFGFDGFDWDIEGNDDPKSQYNHFTVDCLNLMGELSQIAKAKGNYFVAMAPAESYLDPTTSVYDRSLLHEYPEWVNIQPGFAYHGHNTYAYLLDKFGFTKDPNDPQNVFRTFDFVTIQLYEGYSHAEYNITVTGVPPEEYLVEFVEKIQEGWMVNFSEDVELRYPFNKLLSLERTEVVIGLANGWAGDGKFLLIYPEQVEVAFKKLELINKQPRGFAFWNILDEGKASPQRPSIPVWLAAGLNRFLQTR